MKQARLLQVIATELRGRPTADPVKILDLGCGWGGLMAEIHEHLPAMVGDRAIEVHGLEVGCHRAAEANYRRDVTARLDAACPGVDWGDRIHVVEGAVDAYPFEDGAFDLITSTQVLEHVGDHMHCFGEQRRVLSGVGCAVHVFPARECLVDGHLNLFAVHRIEDFHTLERYIRFMSRLGFGKWKGEYRRRKEADGIDTDRYARYQAEYMHYQTNYISTHSVLKVAKACGLKASYRHTRLGRPIARLFMPADHEMPYWLWRIHFAYIKRFGSVTLLLEKNRLERYGVFVK